MKSVIIDTSTLFEIAKIDKVHKYTNIPSLNLFIEGQILYDEMLYDTTSIESLINEEIYGNDLLDSKNRNTLNELVSLCNAINIEDQLDYQGLLESIKNKTEHYFENIELIERHNEVFSEDELQKLEKYNWDEEGGIFLEDSLNSLGVNFFYPSMQKSTLIGKKSKNDKEGLVNSTTANQLLRVFYYQTLQESFDCHYQPHPHRHKFFLADIKSNIGSNIIYSFDKNVRESFESKKTEYFGAKNLSFKMPMLSAYMLKGINSFEDLLSKITEVKESKKAQDFRHAINSLEDALHRRNNVEIQEVIKSIDEKVEVWQKDLGKPIVERKVTLCSPIAETDVNIPTTWLYNNNSKKILVFIHELLRNA